MTVPFLSDRYSHLVRCGGKNLDGNRAIEPGIASSIDFAHAAGAEWGLNFVVTEFRA